MKIDFIDVIKRYTNTVKSLHDQREQQLKAIFRHLETNSRKKTSNVIAEQVFGVHFLGRNSHKVREG